MQFDYYYGTQAEQFTFYRIPKLLITSPVFKKLSDSAKLLYGMMLDRLSLSIEKEKNYRNQQAIARCKYNDISVY